MPPSSVPFTRGYSVLFCHIFCSRSYLTRQKNTPKKPTATTLWRACGSGQAQKKRGCFYICHIPYFILLIVGKYIFKLGLSLFLLSPERQCVACHLSRRLPLRPPFGPALYLALHAAWLKAVITNSKISKNSNKNKQIALTMFLASIGFFLFLRKLILKRINVIIFLKFLIVPKIKKNVVKTLALPRRKKIKKIKKKNCKTCAKTIKNNFY